MRKCLEVVFECEVEDDDTSLFGAKERQSFVLTSLSSSVIVSNILEALYLMTLTNCGGATSVTNLAMREFAIFPLEVFVDLDRVLKE